MKKVIKEADDVFEFAETMNREDEESYDVDEELQKVVDKYRKEVSDRAKVTASKGTPTPKPPENNRTLPRSNRKSTNNSPGSDLVYKRDCVCCKVCSKHVHLTGAFSRSEVVYRKNYSKEIVKIDPPVKTSKTIYHYNKHAKNSAMSLDATV
jgi:hypothetical protein